MFAAPSSAAEAPFPDDLSSSSSTPALLKSNPILPPNPPTIAENSNIFSTTPKFKANNINNRRGRVQSPVRKRSETTDRSTEAQHPRDALYPLSWLETKSSDAFTTSPSSSSSFLSQGAYEASPSFEVSNMPITTVEGAEFFTSAPSGVQSTSVSHGTEFEDLRAVQSWQGLNEPNHDNKRNQDGISAASRPNGLEHRKSFEVNRASSEIPPPTNPFAAQPLQSDSVAYLHSFERKEQKEKPKLQPCLDRLYELELSSGLREMILRPKEGHPWELRKFSSSVKDLKHQINIVEPLERKKSRLKMVLEMARAHTTRELIELALSLLWSYSSTDRKTKKKKSSKTTRGAGDIENPPVQGRPPDHSSEEHPYLIALWIIEQMLSIHQSNALETLDPDNITRLFGPPHIHLPFSWFVEAAKIVKRILDIKVNYQSNEEALKNGGLPCEIAASLLHVLWARHDTTTPDNHSSGPSSAWEEIKLCVQTRVLREIHPLLPSIADIPSSHLRDFLAGLWMTYPTTAPEYLTEAFENGDIPFDPFCGLLSRRILLEWIMSLSASPSEQGSHQSDLGTVYSAFGALLIQMNRQRTISHRPLHSSEGDDNKTSLIALSPTIAVGSGHLWLIHALALRLLSCRGVLTNIQAFQSLVLLVPVHKVHQAFQIIIETAWPAEMDYLHTKDDDMMMRSDFKSVQSITERYPLTTTMTELTHRVSLRGYGDLPGLHELTPQSPDLRKRLLGLWIYSTVAAGRPLDVPECLLHYARENGYMYRQDRIMSTSPHLQSFVLHFWSSALFRAFYDVSWCHLITPSHLRQGSGTNNAIKGSLMETALRTLTAQLGSSINSADKLFLLEHILLFEPSSIRAMGHFGFAISASLISFLDRLKYSWTSSDEFAGLYPLLEVIHDRLIQLARKHGANSQMMIGHGPKPSIPDGTALAVIGRVVGECHTPQDVAVRTLRYHNDLKEVVEMQERFLQGTSSGHYNPFYEEPTKIHHYKEKHRYPETEQFTEIDHDQDNVVEHEAPSIPDLQITMLPTTTVTPPAPVLSIPVLSNEWIEGLKNATMTMTVPLPSECSIGLKNLGNTCYLNSLLQCLLCTTCFVSNLFRVDTKSSGSHQYGKRSIMKEFQRLVSSIVRAQIGFWKGDGNPVINVSKFLKRLPDEYQKNDQMDSTEFARTLFSALGGQENDFICCVFGGDVTHIVECLECGHASRRPERIQDITLTVPPTSSTNNKKNTKVSALLKKFLEPDYPTGYRCEGCSRAVTCKKYVDVSSPPAHLFLILNRSSWDMKHERAVKVLTEVNLEAHLSIGSFNYTFYAAVMHSGSSASAGHYTAIGRRTESHEPEQWYRFNDSIVKRLSNVNSAEDGAMYVKNRQRKTAAEDNPDLPYVLFYRCDESPKAPNLTIPDACR